MRFILCLVASLVLSSSLYGQEIVSWNNVSTGIKESEVLSVGVAPWNSQEVYAGTSAGIYQTDDHGAHWKKVMTTQGDNATVYCISFSAKGADFIYAGTGNGLYRSSDYGKRWQQVFRGGASGERAVFWVESVPNDPQRAYAATSLGLFASQDGGKDWGPIKTLPIHSPVHRVLCHPSGESLWVVSDPGIFFSKDQGKSWERIWVSPSQPADENIPEETSDTVEEFSSTQQVKQVVLQPIGEGKTRLLAGTSQGLLAQDIGSASWEMLSQFGITAREIYSVALNPVKGRTIFVGTDQGVYYWDGEKDHWENFSSGMVGQRIHELEFSRSGDQLWAATERGIYYAKISSAPLIVEQQAELPNFLTPQEILSRYSHEPSMEQVQQWAIRYADVHPEKILRWRKGAQAKAYFPQLSVALNRQRDENVDVAEEGTTTPDHYIVGPDEQTFDFNVSLKWDMGDVIWSDSQTSIDVRSRLMVQLRDDILDEVTRLYFERRRLQIERELSPSKDIRLQVTQELRFQELTAQINGLTGGEFSRQTQEK